jgi:transcriptional regulator with XRE-family HTH domain
MGTLGQYLRSARESRGIDLREAAQQTRISYNYLKALEEEDFSRLPGEVFVKGFLKNYGKFLRLDDFEVMKRYGESREQKSAIRQDALVNEAPKAVVIEQNKLTLTRFEPFLWGAGIAIALILFVFAALPERHREAQKTVMPISSGHTGTASLSLPQTDKLYLEVVALEDTWLLVRTDNSPQKKAVLKKNESLIWSADERFLLSYGSAKALKLMLNGQELTVNEPGNAAVRDLAITATGIVNRNIQPEKILPRKKSLPAERPQQTQPHELTGPQQPATTPKSEQSPLPGPPTP